MSSHLSQAIFRIARPTNDLSALKHFYCTGLGFSVQFEFDQAGFSGMMLGLSGHGYHLEFTRQEGENVARAPTSDHLMVFFLPDAEQWEKAVQRLVDAKYEPVSPSNAYWAHTKGKTFEDPDGYRVVLQNEAWTR